LENLQGALKANDYDLAAEAAEHAQRSARGLSVLGELQEQRQAYLGGGPEERARAHEMARRLERNAQKAQEIEQKLSQLFPPSSQLMSEEDRESLKGMAAQQRDLQKRAQELQRRMQGMQQRAPIFGKDAQRQMQVVGQQMEAAEGELESKEPGRAHSQQRAALEGLQQFAQRMDEAQRQSGGSMPMPVGDGPAPEDGRELSREKVEIPDPDDSKAPREFRKDLLEAMKQGVPERYREQVKRYYEELVQ
jgi:hypothetical protein